MHTIILDAELSKTEGASLDYESRVLLQFCQAELKLIETYTSLTKVTANEDTPMEAQHDDEVVIYITPKIYCTG